MKKSPARARTSTVIGSLALTRLDVSVHRTQTPVFLYRSWQSDRTREQKAVSTATHARSGRGKEVREGSPDRAGRALAP